MNGYRDIAANVEDLNNVYIIFLTSAPYKLPKDVESDWNPLAYGDLFCNAIYTSSRGHKL